jgi:NitT/TauT family transport system permease protein
MIYNSQTSRSYYQSRFLGDFLVVGFFIFLIYGSVLTAQRWSADLQTQTQIDLSFASLPLYGIYSLFRASIAYFLSLTFSLVIGYLAAKYKTMEQLLLPLLDMAQSIPVLGFLPGLVLGFLSIFSHSNTGLELACILMIFTGQVWNLTFSFYASLKNVPVSFYELSQNINLSGMQKFTIIELPFSASGLAWNSLMSMAGGWFFLTVCEAFTLGGRDFRLPGLGSYMALAIEKGDTNAMLAGFLAVIILVSGMDFIIWRPIIAWTRRFRLDEQSEAVQDIPFVQLLLQESRVVRAIEQFFVELAEKFSSVSKIKESRTLSDIAQLTSLRHKKQKYFGFLNTTFDFLSEWHFFSRLILTLAALASSWIIFKIFLYLQHLSKEEIVLIVQSTLSTFLRVMAAVFISTLWTVPFGLWVGLSQQRTRFFQPIIQVAASFPAPMLYPLALLLLDKAGVPLALGSSVLMLLGVQWYVLFNVLAGATMISRELIETFKLVGLSKKDTWLNLYLPSILPALVTGWVTAVGGAWNASIVAEYIPYRGETRSTLGLGALINEATSKGNFSLLVGAMLAMTIVVTLWNRLLWSRVYSWVEQRFKFER